MKTKKGFTIVELLLAILIIAIITVVALPGIFDAVKESRMKKYSGYENLLKERLEMYNIDLKEDLWGNSSTTSVSVSKDQLKARYKDLDINDKTCEIVGNMKITKAGNEYKYSVCIKCAKQSNGSYEYVSSYCG